MEFQHILYGVEGSIATITINREKQMNALNIECVQEISEAHSLALKDKSVRGILLTGAGDKAFVAGADIKEFSSFTEEEGEDMSLAGQAVFRKLELSPKPVVAAINGFALGGGCELAMACHIRIAADNATFGQPEVNLGLIPGYGGTQRLIKHVGYGKAMELLCSGKMIKAEEAYQFGLVSQLTPAGEAVSAAKKLLNTIASKSPLTIERILKLGEDYYTEEDGFENEAREFGASFGTEDFKEGVNAFIEKRKADFKGA